MTDSPLSADAIKPYLLGGCGYRADLLQEDYKFAGGQAVELVAFAHHPFDTRSACIAAFRCTTNDPKAEVMQRRELGAPLVFAGLDDRLQVWRPGPVGAECLEPGLTEGQIRGFFAEHEADLAPGRIYEAKTLGRIPGSGRQLDEFVDARLLPF